MPLQRPVTRYLEATGNAAPIKNVDLVARVQGFLQSINYQDGACVKEGTTLFTIEPETYRLKLEQAQAAEAGAQATVKQAEADFERQSDLVQRQGLAGDARYAPRPATTRGPICSRPRSIPGSRRSITATPTWQRRSTASSARIWSRSASWSAPRRRRRSRPSCNSIRSM